MKPTSHKSSGLPKIYSEFFVDSTPKEMVAKAVALKDKGIPPSPFWNEYLEQIKDKDILENQPKKGLYPNLDEKKLKEIFNLRDLLVGKNSFHREWCPKRYTIKLAMTLILVKCRRRSIWRAHTIEFNGSNHDGRTKVYTHKKITKPTRLNTIQITHVKKMEIMEKQLEASGLVGNYFSPCLPKN